MWSGGEWAAACVDHSAIHPVYPLGSEPGASSEQTQVLRWPAPRYFLLSQILSKIAFESFSSASQMLLPQSLESEWHCMFQPPKRTFMEGNWANWGSETLQETMCFDKKKKKKTVGKCKGLFRLFIYFLWVIMMILWIIILCHSCLDVWLFVSE